MIELPLVFFGGLLGSAHCVGMCGGFALLIGTPARRWSANLTRQLVYSCGRIFTYCALGGTVGYGGLRLAEGMRGFINVQAAVSIGAGVLLVAQGLISAGVVGRATRAVRMVFAPRAANTFMNSGPLAAEIGCLMGGIVGTFLRDRRLGHVFLAGVFTGLLPCGLVYAYLAFAASTSDLFSGVKTMAAFGLGTIPLMVVAGSGATLLSLAGRRRLLYVSAWCVVLTGILSITRGIGFLQLSGGQAAVSCPFCD